MGHGLPRESVGRCDPRCSLPMVKRVLLIVSSSAGAGTDDRSARRLFGLLQERIAHRADVSLRCVTTHAQAAAATRAFLAGGPEPAAILVGGGGGTCPAGQRSI